MSRHLPLLFCASVAVLAGCSEPDANETCGDVIAARANPSADFASYQTFALLPESDYPADLPGDLPDDLKTDLDTASDTARSELIALGLMEVDPATAEPDLYVFSVASTSTDSALEWQCVPGYTWWGLWGWVWEPCAWIELVEVSYALGTIVVGVADPATEEVVFGGAIQGVLACDSPVQRIADGVPKIFDSWPG